MDLIWSQWCHLFGQQGVTASECHATKRNWEPNPPLSNTESRRTSSNAGFNPQLSVGFLSLGGFPSPNPNGPTAQSLPLDCERGSRQ